MTREELDKMQAEYVKSGGKVKKLQTRQHQSAFAILENAKSRAKAYKRSFDLDINWVLSKLASGRCEATGIPFDRNGEFARGGKKGHSTNPFVPSIDRIDSNLGYTQDNCQMVVWIYNRAKGEHSHELLVEFARKLIEAEDEKLCRLRKAG